jgi:hypothetical protein
MKVLLYAVFKVQAPVLAGGRSHHTSESRDVRESAPSKLNSAARDCRAFLPIDVVAQSLTVPRPLRFFASCARQKFGAIRFGDPHREGRATDVEKHRAASSHPNLSSKEPVEP